MGGFGRRVVVGGDSGIGSECGGGIGGECGDVWWWMSEKREDEVSKMIFGKVLSFGEMRVNEIWFFGIKPVATTHRLIETTCSLYSSGRGMNILGGHFDFSWNIGAKLLAITGTLIETMCSH